MSEHPYQVIILAGGKGQRMYPFTEKFPKALMPVANKPLIAYQLEALEKYGFTSVLVILKHSNLLEKYLKHEYKGSIEIVIKEVSSDLINPIDALVDCWHKIKRDFILLSSDLITDISFDELVEFHTKRNSLLTAVFAENVSRVAEDDDEIDFIAINEETGRLLSLQSLDEVREESFKLRITLLSNNPQISLNFNVRDTHIFICKYELLEYLKHTRKAFTDMKEDLIPFLIDNQYNRQFQQKLQGFSSEAYSSQLPLEIGVFAFVSKAFSRRVTELNSYMAANQDAFAKAKSECLLPSVNNEKEIDLLSIMASQDPSKKPKPQDASVGEGSTIGLKPTFTKSFIGKGCKIGDNVKIAFSVVFPHSTIESNVTIQNSVIGSKALIKEKAKVQASYVGHGATVDEKVTNDFIV